MRIAVCLKQVPESGEAGIDPETKTIIRSSTGSVINPLDEFPLELALRFKDAAGAEVTAFTMGPRKAEEVLARAMAMGADSGTLITGKAFAGSDTWSTSLTISKAIEKNGPFDLILCGKQAIDGDTAQVGPEIAAHLGFPQAVNVNKVEMPLEKKPRYLKVTRLFENGFDELEIPLPALLTVLKDVCEPRFGTLEGRLDFFVKGVKSVSEKELCLDPDKTGLKGSPTKVFKTEIPKIDKKQLILEDTAEVQAKALCKILKEKIELKQI